jgi:hypothetical protein
LQQHHVTTQRLRKSPELSSTSNAAKSTTHTTSQPQMDSATPQVPFEGQLEDVQWQELADAVTILKRNCPICWMAHSIARPPHPTIADPAHSDKEVVAIQTQIEMWKGAIRWQAWGACFLCGLPWAMCPRFERLASGRCRVLPNRHCVPLKPTEGRTPVILILWSLAYYYGPSSYREQLQKWLQDTGVTATDSVAIGQWLSVKIEWEGHEASRIHQAFT